MDRSRAASNPFTIPFPNPAFELNPNNGKVAPRLACAVDGTIIDLMQNPLAEEMLKVAASLAKEAAEVSLPRMGRTASRRKPDQSVVTETDDLIQSRMVDQVTRRYPEHAIIAEETFALAIELPQPTAARYCWVIDPLDGTRNFVAGFPCFATSIAVLDRGQPIVAVVFEHNLGHLYTATAGAGAQLQGRPIQVREPPSHRDILLGVPSSKDSLTQCVARSWHATNGFVLRNMGSAAMHLAMVASGALSGAFCKRCKIWDIAAGALLVIEAGGRFSDPFGGSRLPFRLDADPDEDLPTLAAAPVVHGQLLDSIKSATEQPHELG
ncbi:MAG: inositol monophosphatase [Planctomycetes bacterium]|nr:inositol monophosphatase [Planctomycetota bacterium]